MRRRSVASYLIATNLVGTKAYATNDNAAEEPGWPRRALRIVVGFPAGSTPDLTARVLAEGLARSLGQAVYVENRPGASGNIAAAQVARASDAYTLGLVINGNMSAARQLYPHLPYDPLRDLACLSLLTQAPLLLVTPPGLPSGRAFFDAARAQGDRWNYGSPGLGTLAHLGLELLKTKAPGLRAQHVPFTGNPQVVTALLGGQIQMALLPPGIALPQVHAGKLKAVGVSGARSVLAPDVAPLSEAGIDGFELSVWNGLVGPAGLPRSVVERLSQSVAALLREPATRQRLFDQGWQVLGSSPEAMAQRVRDETVQLGGVIRRLDLHLD